MSQAITFDYVPKEQLLSPGNSNPAQERKKPTKAYFSAGEAHFKIISVEEGFSRAGKPKTMFHLEIEDLYGQKGRRTEHVSNKAALTFMKISEAIGGGIYREGGFFADEVIGKSGMLVIGIKESEEWGVQNEVTDWIPHKGSAQPNKFATGLPKAAKEVDLDDIPF